MQKAARFLIIGLLFTGVLWGFWVNNASRMAELERERRPASRPLDATRTLTKEQETALALFIDNFFKAYGVPLDVRVSAAPLPETWPQNPEQAGTVFLGLCPAARQVVFYAPPLVRGALGEPLSLYLAHVHFLPYYAGGNWPEGLAAALNLITARLDAKIAR